MSRCSLRFLLAALLPAIRRLCNYSRPPRRCPLRCLLAALLHQTASETSGGGLRVATRCTWCRAEGAKQRVINGRWSKPALLNVCGANRIRRLPQSEGTQMSSTTRVHRLRTATNTTARTTNILPTRGEILICGGRCSSLMCTCT